MTKLLRALALLLVFAVLGSAAAFAEATAAPEATALPESAANADGTFDAQLLTSLPYTAEEWLVDDGARTYFAVLMMMEASTYKELGLDADIQDHGIPGIYMTTLTAETVPSLTVFMFYEAQGRAWVCTYYPDAKTFRVEEAEVADTAAAHMEALTAAGTIGESYEVVNDAIIYVLDQLQTAVQQ